METKDVVVIGGGPAGLTAALYTSRALLSTVIFIGQSWGGQLMLTTKVDNYPGFPEGILGPELMQRMVKQVENFSALVLKENITRADFSSYPFKVESADHAFLARAIIIATGASPKWLGLPNEQKLIGHGVSSCAPCDAFFFKGQRVAVVGGGDSAMEEALVLSKYASDVTIVNRSGEFKATSIMLKMAKKEPKIKFLINKIVVDVLGEKKVEGIVLEDVVNKEKVSLDVTGLFVAIGHKPATDLFREQLALDERGFMVVKNRTQTSVPGVFVAGDAADSSYRQAVTAAGFGCMAALDAEKWLEKRAL